jgi:F-box interacting protein
MVLFACIQVTIKIANLATGECMHLAKPVKNSKGDDHFSFYSFGFNPVTNEYKVMHFRPDKQLNIGGSFSVIQVYTLGDERWRVVRTPQALSLNCVKHSGVVNVNGAMYWLTEDTKSSWLRAVVSFDLKDEDIELILLPLVDFSNSALDYPLCYQITEIDGKVSVASTVITRSDSGLTRKLQIWTLDNKLEQSWSQKYNIQLSSLHVLGPHFIYGDNILMHNGYDKGIYCHGLVSQSFTVEETKLVKLLHFSPRWDNNMQSYLYVNSLVRLDAYKKAGIVRMPKRKDGWKLKKWEAWPRGNTSSVV